jgi:dipeptidyl aminopeptidase/acylaminoacyl peptidase
MANYNQIRYDLMRIAFDPETCSFGEPDTVLRVSDKGKSLSFPRISPDNKYLLYCLADYGNFTIWHPESDIYLLDLVSGKISYPDINSKRTESFHEWSSTGRWIVFSSRRDDGLYTKPYFAYFDTSGIVHKPFLLPQKSPEFYLNFMKSYNIPEFVTSRIELNPRKLERLIKTAPVNAELIKN